ncbi:hypothetical protein A0H81_10660 [Grifola frondosa]|uniref:Uncharacterized protein n=1 Tax=Grifola frondosa TaxID=5627 RepID=A0A1C7M316_GRIFR|nr:hypothetical protein A0H81_10660 [Grifola frondosa]
MLIHCGATLVIVADPSCSTPAKDGVAVHSGTINSEYDILQTLQEGYGRGIIIEAAIQHQSGAKHPDPIRPTAHFLRVTPRRAMLHVHALHDRDHDAHDIRRPRAAHHRARRDARRYPRATEHEGARPAHSPTRASVARASMYVRDAHDPVYLTRSSSGAEGMQ